MSSAAMGVLNQGWGICGFTSSLYALYNHSPAQQARLTPAARTATRMLAEIKTYLRLLQADGRYDLLGSIETFTRTFGGQFANFTIDAYILSINQVANFDEQTLLNIKDDPIYSIAMPPLAVVDYLQRACELRAARIVQTDAAELILGLCGTKMQMYGGLEHYVYQLNGKVYSWGKEFNSVEHAAISMRTTWNVGYKIAIV